MLLPDHHQTLTQMLTQVVSPIALDQSFSIQLERPKSADHGDVACNVAMQLAKKLQRNPRELAEQMISGLKSTPNFLEWFTTAEVAGPGFINLRLQPHVKYAVVSHIFEQQQRFGYTAAHGQKVLVEFVSANPTGPLHVGHARQAALGDAICRLFSACGWQVTKEFYYNDAGNQIDNLTLSVQARAQGILPEDPTFPADGYRGDYILDIANDFIAKKTVAARGSDPVTASGDVNDVESIRRFAVTYLRNEQDLDLQAFDLNFDQYYLESSLYTSGRVENTVQQLIESGHTYELDGALWLRTTELHQNDDKDRVMRKKEGGYTYFVPDVAYHVAKWERGYTKAINIQGSDHHGTIARVRSGLEALNMGIPQGYPDYILHKMVKVIRDGQEVKISKRAGSYVTLRDLIDWVGKDVVRFFLISRKADTEFIFDVDLACKKSDENPVFYVQYAHARICSILAQANISTQALQQADLTQLIEPKEWQLLQRLAEFPSVVYNAAQDLAPHQIAFWLKDCAADFHAFYNECRVLVEVEALKQARLALLFATRQVLANGLELLGVSHPDKL